MNSSNATRVLESTACDSILASDPFTVAWLTGYAPDVISGPSPFALPPLAVVRPDASVALLVSADEEFTTTDIEVWSYEGYTLGELQPSSNRLAAFRSLGVTGRVGVEKDSLSAAIAVALEGATEDISEELRLLRAVKTEAEIALIRASINLCDIAQECLRAAAVAGSTELELWSQIALAVESAAGMRVPILADLASGDRSAAMGGAPTTRVTAGGELILADIVPRLAGYWGDSCATVAIGEPSADMRSDIARATDALERGLAALRPGTSAGEVDAACRGDLEYPHHSGHGIGTAYHEEPRIVPGGRTVLEPGMVVALEPAVYRETYGIRVEKVAVITETGCDVISGHSLAL